MPGSFNPNEKGLTKINGKFIQRETTPLGTFPLRKRFVKALIARLKSTNQAPKDDRNCELDSHADTVCAGREFVMFDKPERYVNVYPFAEEYKPLEDIPIATAATVWTSEQGTRYLLLFHEALFFGDRLDKSLICTNQLRAHGLVVEDVPRQFDRRSTHSIRVPDCDDLTIPLELNGIMSCFATYAPTPDEMENLPRVVMTSSARWRPNSKSFADAEENLRIIAGTMTICKGDPNCLAASAVPRMIAAATSYRTLMENNNLDIHRHDNYGEDDDLYHRLIKTVHVASDDMTGDGLSGHIDNDVYTTSEEVKRISAIKSDKDRRSTITPELLSRRWCISLPKAAKTLAVTTQAGVRNVLTPSERKVRKKAPWLKFPNVKGRWYCDLMFSKVPSIHGDNGATVYTNGQGYDVIYPWKTKGDHADTLMSLIQDVGIPQTLISDGGKELIYGRARDTCTEYRINQRYTVPYSPWQNAAEGSVREIKKGTRRKLRYTGAPRRTWSYAAKWVVDVRRFLANDHPACDGRTGFEHVTGSTPDISPLALFDFWEPVQFLMPVEDYPYEKKHIGRWLGIASNCTDDMAYIVLPKSGIPITRKDVWGLSEDELKTPAIAARLVEYDRAIKERLGDDVEIPLPKEGDAFDEYFPPVPSELFEGDNDEGLEPFDPDEQKMDADEYTPAELDEYLTAEVLLPYGGEKVRAIVKHRVVDNQGLPVGLRNNNPILDTRQYEVEFPDGSTDAFTANMIAENLYSQIDEEGRSYAILKDIVGHRKDSKAVKKTDEDYINGRKRHTTAGWQLEAEFADGTTHWIPLKDLKDSNCVEVAEYAVASQIADEPAFAWWVRTILRRRDVIIKKVKTRYWKRTHKFGIELPKSVKEAYAIDRRTGTDFWRLAIEKEMANNAIAFEFCDGDVIPIGFKHIDCHMIFDIKSDLTRKARFVAGGHQTDPPKESIYSSVVSRDSVRIAFMLAALNDLDVLAADVQNAYLNASTKEKVYTTAGPEFGPTNQGRPVLIVRALYGLKSSGARWRDHCAATLRDAHFKSCPADPDVWMRPNTKPDGTQYWEYVLLYVDDALACSHDPQAIMDHLASRYTLKKGSVKEPTEYLGAEIRKHYVTNPDGTQSAKPRWAMSSDLYVKRALADVERELAEIGQTLKSKVSTPLSADYRPELDTTPELDARRANYYQGLIGVLRWIVELGRIDIIVPIALLSRFLALPREGHLEQVLHCFAYLKQYNRSSIVFDDTSPHFDETRFVKAYWGETYPDAVDPLPHNMPEPRGQSVSTTCFVDADHAGCRVTRRSHTGIILFVNRTPVMWYSKRQNTVETSTFGSEFVAMKTAIEQIEGLRYKLRMMGVPLDGPTSTFCDNESVFKNSTVPESTIKKKHCSIAYHRTREAIAAGIVRIAWESGETNLADILTKLMPRPRLQALASRILW